MKKLFNITFLLTLLSFFFASAPAMAQTKCRDLSICAGKVCETGECQIETSALTLAETCICYTGGIKPSAPALTPGMPTLVNPTDKLQIKIPGLDLGDVTCTGSLENKDQVCSVPWLANYIAGIYKYLLGIAAVLATIVMMIGGFRWVISAGNPQSISEAKAWINGSIVGLIILFTSWILLTQINPDLTRLKSISTYILAEEVLDTNDPTQALSNKPADLYCPNSGGVSEIPKIAQSFNGKVTYRFGGKGGNPPYNDDTKTCGTTPCKDFCPNGTVCLDCSGFVGQILQCAGLGGVSGGTASIFSGAEAVTSITDTTANGKELKPGDLLGNPTTKKPEHIGHVYIYIGNGQVAESGASGRTPGGTAMMVSNVSRHKAYIEFIKRR